MKREEIDIDRIDRLVAVLEDWAAWNSRYSAIRVASCSVGLTSGYASSKSFDDMLVDVENSVAQIVDAAVDDLPPGQIAAINRRYGLCAVFRFPRGNYETLLFEAHEALLKTLQRKGVVI